MTKKSTLTVVKKAYSIDYLLKNPPANSLGLKHVWSAAVMEYMSKEGVDLSDKKMYHKPLTGIDFSKVVRIFKTLAGTATTKKAKTTKKSKTRKTA